jgi:hypothetical protein
MDDHVIGEFQHRGRDYTFSWEYGAVGNDIVLSGPVMDAGGRWRPGLRDFVETWIEDHDIPILHRLRGMGEHIDRVVYTFSRDRARGIARVAFASHALKDEAVKAIVDEGAVYGRRIKLANHFGIKVGSNIFESEVETLDVKYNRALSVLVENWEHPYKRFLDLADWAERWFFRPTRRVYYWDGFKVADCTVEDIAWLHLHIEKIVGDLGAFVRELEGDTKD